MTYVGATPTTGDFKKLDSITTSSATTFNLRQNSVAVYPQSANHCIVSLNGVIQAPVDAFTIVNDTIVFASSLASSDVINFILVLGNVNDIGTPSDDTITAAKLNNTAISGLSALAATPDDTDELMISDAGTLKRIDYSHLKSSVVNRPNALPIIINGDMAVAQRATSATGKTSAGYYTCDRWNAGVSNLGTWTIAQESLSSGNAYDNGFLKSFRIDCTTADASPAAGDLFVIKQVFEGQDLQLIKKGKTDAEKLTLSFWVKATKTGTNILELYDNDNTRQVSIAYTISSSNTWEQKIINIPADTTGAFDNDNAASLNIQWGIGAGSNFTSGTLNTSWAASTNANRFVGQVNHADSTSNDFAITGVQLEVGEFDSDTLPSFEHESYGDNLTRCKRYFQYSTMGYYSDTTGGGYGGATTFAVEHRATPSYVSGYSSILANNNRFNSTVISSANNLSQYGLLAQKAQSLSSDSGYFFAKMATDAEL